MRYPQLNEVNPYFSKDAKFDVEIWLFKGSSKKERLHQQKSLAYDFDPQLPVQVKIPLTPKIKKNPKKYKVVMFLKMYEQNGRKQTFKAESPIVLTRNREVTHRSSDDANDLKKLTVTSKEGHFEYLTTKLYFVLVHDQRFHYFENDHFSRFLYSGKVVKLATDELQYMPILDDSQWWLLNRYLLPLDDLETEYAPDETFPKSDEPKQNSHINAYFWVTSLRKHSWSEQFRISEEQNLFPELNVFDEFKALLVDNTPTYLTILFSVNFLHTLFSLLSIRQNVLFYNNLSNNIGISSSQAYSDVIFEFVGLLFLVDNDTSLLIVVLTGLEFLFKVWIALRVSPFRLSPRFPFVTRKPATRDEELLKTRQSEQRVVRYLLMLFTPLFVAYLGYSVLHFPEKTSLYSFVLEKSVTFIYIVGFANMFPQIYINYNLKSVEYMPWKALMYKFFNTIIDDLFAFAVKMPTLKRISCFRDDIVFVIFLVQWYIYRNNEKRGRELYEKPPSGPGEPQKAPLIEDKKQIND